MKKRDTPELIMDTLNTYLQGNYVKKKIAVFSARTSTDLQQIKSWKQNLCHIWKSSKGQVW